LEREQPDVRIVNLETSITRSEDFVAKGINYRTSPENARCLASAGINCCVLANNHVLDWGESGLFDTIEELDRLGISYTGAGRNSSAAQAPAILDRSTKGRVIVFSFALATSGVPRDWRATSRSAGVNLLPDLSEASISHISDLIGRSSQPGDIVVVSLHWGPNWGYEIPEGERRFARGLIDRAGVSIIHGHSSHHPKGIEIYRDRLVLYGCGDFIDDYEGIAGREEYRGDLAPMYFATIDPHTRILTALRLVPLQTHRFRLRHAQQDDVDWLMQNLDRQSEKFGVRVKRSTAGALQVSW
jgi:poly-gamma-glutamate synthesis protein (capsule biosynthesis protein)